MPKEFFNPFEVVSERAYVVYDPRSGEIVHEHIVTNFKGAHASTPKQEEAQALKLAKQSGHAAKGLRVLPVDAKRLDDGRKLRVDPKTQKLAR